MLPIAVDAMGGDRAPGEILAGAHAAAEAGIPIVLVGPAGLDGIGDLIIGVNGKPWTAMSLSAVRSEFRAAPGRKLRRGGDGRRLHRGFSRLRKLLMRSNKGVWNSGGSRVSPTKAG